MHEANYAKNLLQHYKKQVLQDLSKIGGKQARRLMSKYDAKRFKELPK